MYDAYITEIIYKAGIFFFTTHWPSPTEASWPEKETLSPPLALSLSCQRIADKSSGVPLNSKYLLTPPLECRNYVSPISMDSSPVNWFSWIPLQNAILLTLQHLIRSPKPFDSAYSYLTRSHMPVVCPSPFHTKPLLPPPSFPRTIPTTSSLHYRHMHTKPT